MRTIDGDINAPITVVSEMVPGKIIPESFTWRGKTYKVERLVHSWREDIALNLKEYHVTVDSGKHTFELILDSKTQRWRMGKIV